MKTYYKHIPTMKRKTPPAEIYANILCLIFLAALVCAGVYIIVEHSLPVMGYK